MENVCKNTYYSVNNGHLWMVGQWMILILWFISYNEIYLEHLLLLHSEI